MQTWLGLDLGTSSLKALLVAADGSAVARASVPYRQPDARSGAAVEQDPQVWRAAAEEAVAQCLRHASAPPAGIGLTGQVPTLVLCDAVGDPLRAAISWQDNRAVREADELAERLGAALPHLGIELPWAPSQLPAKLAWVARHEPELRRPGTLALQPKDWLGLLLTGSPASDPWSTKGLCEVERGRPAETVLAACGWPVSVCPPTAPGWISRGATRGGVLGLPDGIPVSVGLSDALTAMMAVGAFAEPRAFALGGTSEVVGISLPGRAPEAPGLYRVPAACAPLELSYGPTQSSGATLAWLARLIAVDVDRLASLAETARADAAPPVFVPYLSGERAPLWRSDLRGLIAGLSADDGAAELAAAVLCGVAGSVAHVLDVAARASETVLDSVHVTGRAAQDPAWQRIQQRALGVPLLVHEEPFGSALGAAMLGAAAAHDGDLRAATPLIRTPRRVAPGDHEPDRSSADATTGLARYLRASELAQRWSER
jgi:xylulokinase